MPLKRLVRPGLELPQAWHVPFSWHIAPIGIGNDRFKGESFGSS